MLIIHRAFRYDIFRHDSFVTMSYVVGSHEVSPWSGVFSVSFRISVLFRDIDALCSIAHNQLIHLCTTEMPISGN